jgi:SAM-dependent methyltransferase
VPSDDAILRELTALARGTAPGLLQFGSLAAAHQYIELHRTWRRVVPSGAAVLDWGAGNGHFTYFLVRTGYDTTSFSLDAFDFAPWLPAGPGAYRFVAGNLAEPVRLPFADGSFDAVASIGVLEHVRETGGNEAGSLAEIARVLRPGGRFVCWHFPNRWSWIDLLARALPGKHRHLYRYSRADIAALVAGAGLELLEVRSYGILPRNSLHRLLGPARDAAWAARLWDALDAALAVPLRPFVQNHAFVARKPGGAGAGARTGAGAR